MILSGPLINVTSVQFQAFTSESEGEPGGENNEFSVAGMNIAPVPEPATMLLFGTGLLGLAGLRLRRKK